MIIDEFALQVLNKYDDKEFANISSEELDLLNDEEKNDIEKKKEDNKDFIGAIKEALGDKVKDVVISKRLVDSPVCLVSGEGLSFEMEKVLIVTRSSILLWEKPVLPEKSPAEKYNWQFSKENQFHSGNIRW